MARSSAAQRRDHSKSILEAITREQKNSRDHNNDFTALSPDAVEKNLKADKAPFLSGFGWSSQTPAGGLLELRTFIWNSESNPAPNIYVHVWVGSGNIDPAPGTFLLNVDSRFPRLTRPEHPGLTTGDPHEFPLSPGLKRLDFALRLPSDLEESTYLGNICLMQLASHDVGRYLGRGVFPFAVRGGAPSHPNR